MSISAADRTKILAVTVTMFDKAPDTAYLSSLVDTVAGGTSVLALADTLAATDAYKAIYPTMMSNTEWATKLLDNLVGTTVSAAEKTWGVNTLVALLNAGSSRGAVIYEAAVALNALDTSNAGWGTAAAMVQNKITVASYYSVTQLKQGTGDLQDVLSTVTSTAASVTAAKAAIDAPAASTAATFALTANATSVDEGATAYYTLATTNVAAGTQYSWTITGVSSADVVGGDLAGTATIDADGNAIVGVSLVNDTLTEGSETMTLTVASKATGVTVADTSLTAAAATTATATFALTANATSVNEGATAYYTLATTNVAAGTQYSWSVAGVSSADVVGGVLAGTATIDANGDAIIGVSLVNDTLTEGAETMTLTVAEKSTGVTVTDTSLTAATVAATTYTLTASAAAVDEGDSGLTNLVFALALDKPAESDVVVNYTTATTGTATTGVDFDAGSGSVTFVTGQQNANVNVKVIGDTTFETDETITTSFSGGSLVASVSATGTVSNDDSDPDTVAMAKTLTIGQDSFTTGTAADTFDATVASSLDTVDIIDGGTGADTLTATLGNGSVRPTITGVETIAVTATGDTVTIDTRDISGTTTWNSESSDGALVLNNLATIPAINLNSGTDDTTINFTDAAIVGTTDNLALSVNNYVQGAGESVTITDGGGLTNELETITINSSSLASTITSLDASGVETTTLTVTGDADLTINGTVVMTTVSASAFTGDLVVAGPAGASTYTGGSGNDTLTTGAGNDTITGGAGNDILAAAAGTNTVTGGAGNDAITITTGIDTVDAGAGNDSVTQADTSALTTADSITGGDGTDTLILSEATAAFNFAALTAGIIQGFEIIEVSGAVTITVDDANVTNAGGSLTLQETGDDATITVSAAVSAGKTVTLDATTVTLANVANRVTLATTADTADALTLTSDETGTTITLGTGNDIVTGGGSIDTITTNTGTNSVTGEAGNDIINIADGGGTDTIDAGAGNDIITLADISDLTSADSITGGAGSDTLKATENAALNLTSLNNLTGIDVLEVNGAVTVTVDDANVDQSDSDSITITETGTNANITVSAAVGAAYTVILDNAGQVTTLAAGVANRVTLAGTADADADGLTSDEVGESVTLGTGNDIVTGSGSIDTIITAAGTNTVNAGAGADIITIADGGGTDTIDAGAGADIITVTDLSDLTSADSITGGAGSDTLASGETTATWDLSALSNLSGIDVISMMGASTVTVDDANVIQSDTGTSITITETGTDADITVNAVVGAAYTVIIDNAGQTTTLGNAAAGTANRVTLAGTADSDADGLTSDETGEVVTAGTGSDIITGSGSKDTITTGTGTNTITGGAGADIINIADGGGTDIIDAGAGADVITLADISDLTSADSITGGTGSDTLRATEAANLDLTSLSNLTGIDVIEVNGARTVTVDDVNVDQSDSDSITITETGTDANITVSAAVGAAYTVILDNAGQSTTLADSVTNRVTLAGTADSDADGLTSDETGETVVLGSGADIVTGSGSIDTFTLGSGTANITGGAGADIFQSVTANLDGFITIDGGDGTDVLKLTDAATVIDSDFNGMTSIETLLNGNTDATITLGAKATAAGIVTYTGGTANDIVNTETLHSSALTVTLGNGVNAFDASSGGTGVLTVTGGTGVDTITSGAGTMTIVDLDAGADIVNLGSAALTITTMGAGADILIVANGELTSADTIVGGADSDVIVTTGAVTIVDAAFTNITLFEEFESDTNNGIMNLTAGPLMVAAGITTVTGGTAADIINLSGIVAATAMTVVAGNGANVVTGGAGVDTITTGTGADIITGGKGADILVGGNGEDVYVFASTAALNGIDVLAANFVVGDDRFDFSAFGTFTFHGTVIQHDGADNVNVTNKIIMAGTTANDVVDLNTAAKIVAQFGFEEAFQIASGGKAVIIAADDAAAIAGGQIWYIDDTLDGVNGTISATDVVQVASITLDLDTLLAKNFIT